MFDTMIGLTTSVFIILALVSQFGLSIQTCSECTCCAGGIHNCDSNGNCNNGCIDGYYGSKCTEECLENCKTCVNGTECTECKPGYYTHKCNLPCGKGCVNNTCLISSGECSCTSFNFINNNKCDVCDGLSYGVECNNICPSNCGSCTSDTECTWCQNTFYYGSYCQYRCSSGCSGEGKCNKGSGNCTEGCKPGFSGGKCNNCSPGFYGRFCDLNCTQNCISCLSATNCTVCKSGFYGETCTNTCPSGCNENCSFADGKCFDCRPGFVGEFCDTCKDGTYGVNCSQRCQNVDINCQVCIANELGTFENCTRCSSGYYTITAFAQSHHICKSCSNDCKGNVCDKAGFCTNGCLHSKWGDRCNVDCKRNCIECDQNNGACLECTIDTYSDNCSQNCSSYCNRTGYGRICESNTGSCLQGCESITRYGEYCDNQCSSTCINKRCYWETGYCLEGCVMDYYGSFCDNRCADTCQSNKSNRICDDVKGHCLYGCKDGFYGKKCENKCSSQCVNVTCDKVTAECLYGCTDGYEGLKCVLAITGAESEEQKSLVIIAGSAGAGVLIIVLLVILVIFLIQRTRRQKLSSNTKCEENNYVLNMEEFPKQIDEDEPGVIYAKPFKPKREAGGDAGKKYDTAYDGETKIPAIDNGYTAVNKESSANEKSKSFEVCDIAHDKPLSGNNDYAVVNKGKSTVKENECFEEVYDTTHDNKKNKQPLSSNNDYAVLSVRSDNTKGFGKSNLAQPDDVYDSTEGGKHKTMSHPSNDYAVFISNNGDKHGNDKAKTLYDSATDKKMRPENNDYDFCELDTD